MFRIGKVTEKGLDVLHDIISGGTVTFTRMEYGDGILPGLESIVADETTLANYRAKLAENPNMDESEKQKLLKTEAVDLKINNLFSQVTSLVNKCCDIDIGGCNKKDGYVRLQGLFTASRVKKSFRAKELAVFARINNGEEFLFAYFSAVDYLTGEQTDTSDYISSIGISELELQLGSVYVNVAIGNAENVSIDIKQDDNKAEEPSVKYKSADSALIGVIVDKMKQLHSDTTLGQETKWLGSTLQEIDDEGNSLFIKDFHDYFSNAANLKIIKNLYTINAINMKKMFKGCNNLTSIPQMDTSNVTDMEGMFMNCNNLTSIPQMDTSKVTNMRYMFNHARSITTIPQMDTSNVTNMEGMFCDCYALKEIPQMDTSKVTNMRYMFDHARSITTIPQMDTSNVTDMEGMFKGASGLKYLPDIDMQNCTTAKVMFSNCWNLRSFIENPLCKVTPWQIFDDFNLCQTKLDRDSILKVFNGAKVVSGKTIKINTITNGYLSEDDKKIITDKGWTIVVSDGYMSGDEK